MASFQNHCVLITGGTTGINRAIAEAFKTASANVIVTGLTSLEVVEAQRDGLDGRVLDVSDDQGIADLVSSLTRLDVMVNAASMILRAGAEVRDRRILKSH